MRAVRFVCGTFVCGAYAGPMQDEYRTVARAGVHETEVNRSRFLCAADQAIDAR